MELGHPGLEGCQGWRSDDFRGQGVPFWDRSGEERHLPVGGSSRWYVIGQGVGFSCRSLRTAGRGEVSGIYMGEAIRVRTQVWKSGKSLEFEVKDSRL